MEQGLIRETRRVWRGVAAGAALFLAAGAGLAWAGVQGMFGAEGPRSERAARVAEQHAEAARRAEFLAFTDAYRAQRACEMTVGQGETFASLLVRAGATPGDASAAISSIEDVFNPRALRPGQTITVVLNEASHEGARLTGLSFRSQPGASITANRTAGGPFSAREVLMPLTFENARIAGRVEGSLFESATRLGATPEVIGSLADAFAYDVDFQRDVRPGDHYEIVFERFYDDEGNTVRTGDMLFISLETRQGARHFYRFQAPGDARADWYDAEGKSARKFLMKTPVNGARLSSGFGMRQHPILGYSRMHRGVDFRAATGTPIMAAGEGVVVRAGPYSSYGNYVRIRHENGYETAYAHMSRFARGMRAGARVRQGQVIGYVGTTGRSTGPHLHYEVMRRGQNINPMSLRVATGRNLAGHELNLFQTERERIDTLRQARAHESGVAVTIAALEASRAVAR